MHNGKTILDDLNDSGDIRRHQSPEARATENRLRADERMERKCRWAAGGGGSILVVLLAVNVYAIVTDAPRIPSGISTPLVGVAVTMLMAWVMEWLTRSARRHTLGSGSRGYGEGVLDGLKLGSSVGPGFER